ncbi:MAG: hypothetical protein HY892_08065 [Deltaproteobacteria bacterium]|nr:hypothetical protein [Deltaproteobacteria bacterium]
MIILACLLGLGAFFFAGFTVPFIILFHPIIIGSAFVSGKPPNPSEFYRLGGFLFSMDVAIAAGALGIFGGSLIGLGTSGGWGRRKNGIRTAIFTDRIVNDFQLLREVHVAVINESATPRRINPPLNVDLKIKFREKKVAGFEHRWQKIKQTHSIEISKDGLLIDPSQRREIILTVLSLKYNNEYVLSGRLGPYSLGKTNFWSS